MTYHHFVGRGQLRIEFNGCVTHGDIIDCCVNVAADRRCVDPELAVFDFSAASDCSCCAPDIALLAAAGRALVRPGGPSSRVFFIAPSDDSGSQLARLRRDPRVEVCDTEAQARERIAQCIAPTAVVSAPRATRLVHPAA